MFLLKDWMGVAAVSGMILSLFAAGEVLRARRWASERTRKLSHMGCGAVIFFFPYLLKSVHTVGVLSGAFLLLLGVSRALGFLDSIHGVRRSTGGVFYYPVAIYVTALLTWERPAIFQACVLLLAFADGLAALVGKRYGRRKYRLGEHVRTLEGSATVLLVGWVGTTVLLGASGTTGWLSAWMLGALLGGLVTAVEALSLWGLDNLLIPVLSALYLRSAIGWSWDLLLWHLLACGVALAISMLCQLRGYLKLNGAIAAWLVGYVTLGFGGAAWFGPLLGFFLAINWAGKAAEGLAGSRLPADFEKIEEKGSRRDYLQVFANTGVCLGLTLAYAYFVGRSDSLAQGLFWAYLGSLCAASADTFASELGILSRARPVLLWTFRPVPVGLSGGVTWLGYGAAAVGALVPVAVLSVVGGPYPIEAGTWTGAVACGVLGSTVDSVVGATLQEKRRCPGCHKLMERKEHCGGQTVHVSGVRGVSNDLVNAIGAAAGGIAGYWLMG